MSDDKKLDPPAWAADYVGDRTEYVSFLANWIKEYAGWSWVHDGSGGKRYDTLGDFLPERRLGKLGGYLKGTYEEVFRKGARKLRISDKDQAWLRAYPLKRLNKWCPTRTTRFLIWIPGQPVSAVEDRLEVALYKLGMTRDDLWEKVHRFYPNSYPERWDSENRTYVRELVFCEVTLDIARVAEEGGDFERMLIDQWTDWDDEVYDE